MRYPSDFLDRLRHHFSVSEVIGRRISIKRKGREYSALCPFHKENTPSFTINDEKGFYHCFGCGAHGDVIGFVKEYEGVSYKEAIERLADEAGLALPQPSPEVQHQEAQRASLQDVMEAACGWFQQQLVSEAGYEARSYLQERGISPEMVAQFRIGFAPDSRHGLEEGILSASVTKSQLVEGGLLIDIEGKVPYSRFRGRIMFPIMDRRGQVVAFGGRLLREDPMRKAPKYLNSPETPLFQKGQTLFNIDKVRRPALDCADVMICEGYTDVIALAQAGMPAAVAPLGTAITPEQLQLLWRMTDLPVLCLDGDNAGMRAMRRAIDLALPMLSPGKSLRMVTLPKGEDPDSYVKKSGREGMQSMLEGAWSMAEAMWQLSEHDVTPTPDGRALQESQLMKQAEQIADITVRQHYRDYFRNKMFTARRAGGGKHISSKTSGTQTLHVGKTGFIQSAMANQKAQTAIEQMLVFLSYVPEFLCQPEVENALSEMHIADTGLAQIRTVMLEQIDEETSDAATDVRIAELKAHYASAMPDQLVSGEMPNQQTLTACWRFFWNAYELAMVEQACDEAKQAMAQSLDDSSLEHFQACQLQKQQLMKQQQALFNEYSLMAESAA